MRKIEWEGGEKVAVSATLGRRHSEKLRRMGQRRGISSSAMLRRLVDKLPEVREEPLSQGENTELWRRLHDEQVAIAEYCHVDRTHIGHIQAGRRKPSVKTVRSLAGYFSISIDDVFNLLGL